MFVTYSFDTYDCTKRKSQLTETSRTIVQLLPPSLAKPSRHSTGARTAPFVLPSTVIRDVEVVLLPSREMQPSSHRIAEYDDLSSMEAVILPTQALVLLPLTCISLKSS